MLKRAFSIIILVILTAYMTTSMLALVTPETVSAENWVEVVRFTMANNSQFTCTHAKWRYSWSCWGKMHLMQFYGYVTQISPHFMVGTTFTGNNEYNYGTLYVYDTPGTFSCTIAGSNIDGYLIKIEEDIDSRDLGIPEFSSFLILPLFIVATLLIVIVYKQKRAIDRSMIPPLSMVFQPFFRKAVQVRLNCLNFYF